WARQLGNTQRRWRPIAAGARVRQMTPDIDRRARRGRLQPAARPCGDHIVDRVDGGGGTARRAMVTDGYGRRALRAAAGAEGGAPPSTREPAAARGQAS